MRRLPGIVAAVVLVCLLTGCAGFLLSLIFRAVALGGLYAEVTDFLGHSSTEFTMQMDGYDLGIHPASNGKLNLSGMPPGRRVLALVSTDRHIGFVRNVDIQADQQLGLGSITPIQGATISGKVERILGSSKVPVAGVRVAAIFGGSALVTGSASTPITLPPTGDETVLLGFTDEQGNYKLGPAQFGQWLVTVAIAGNDADAAFVTVASGRDAGGVNLLLTSSASAPEPATVRGNVARDGGGALAKSFVAVNLNTPFAPPIRASRLSDLQSQTGGALAGQPWFAWRSIAATTSDTGAFTLQVPPGSGTVLGFKYGYVAKEADISLTAGTSQTADFILAGR